jgi:hypothetical protein
MAPEWFSESPRQSRPLVEHVHDQHVQAVLAAALPRPLDHLGPFVRDLAPEQDVKPSVAARNPEPPALLREGVIALLGEEQDAPAARAAPRERAAAEDGGDQAEHQRGLADLRAARHQGQRAGRRVALPGPLGLRRSVGDHVAREGERKASGFFPHAPIPRCGNQCGIFFGLLGGLVPGDRLGYREHLAIGERRLASLAVRHGQRRVYLGLAGAAAAHRPGQAGECVVTAALRDPVADRGRGLPAVLAEPVEPGRRDLGQRRLDVHHVPGRRRRDDVAAVRLDVHAGRELGGRARHGPAGVPEPAVLVAASLDRGRARQRAQLALQLVQAVGALVAVHVHHHEPGDGARADREAGVRVLRPPGHDPLAVRRGVVEPARQALAGRLE